MTETRSDCCSAPLKVGGQGTTHWWVCTACNGSCNAVPGPVEQAWSPAFHPAPYEQISTHVPDPREFVNELYRALLEARPYFPGDTNYIGHCLDAVLEQLEQAGATREFDDD